MRNEVLRLAAVGLLAAGGFVQRTCAQSTVVVPASGDNTVYSESGELSNGRGPTMFAGATASGAVRRALVRFDAAAALPAHARIHAVTLRLHMSKTTSGATVQSLHALTADWGEGTSNAGEPGGGGTLATPGDATWNFAFYNTAAWSSLGGDFSAPASASATVEAIGDYSWSSAQLVADVQGWVYTPGTNRGWVLVGDESKVFTSKQYASRESLTAAFRPALEVAYFCGADFDRDGFTTGDDFDGYVAAFELGDLGCDFDGDGFVTGDDFDAYVVAFELGC